MILVTGGNGYIGSHFILELLDKGYEVISIDNLVNSSKENIKTIKEISKKNFIFIEGDLRNKKLLNEIFSKYTIDCVVHFAGLKNIIGGEISEYTKLQAQSREQALQRMIEDAEKMGANAIVNVRLTTSMVMQGCSEILAYGTAVIIK